MEDGSLAEPPIALPEVQGEVYLAWRLMAELFWHAGDHPRHGDLSARADRLFARFNEAFWLEREQYFAFCRQRDGRFSSSIASNAAFTLWTGIVAPERAARVAGRALRADMFSGWGVRTLSALDVAYNPVQYQVGSVWPHDNAFIGAGMYQHGCRAEANQILNGILDAAARFPDSRLPEVFAGYPRGRAGAPIRYPVACSPQAWAAGSVPWLLQAALGWESDALNVTLRIRPADLPEAVQWIEIKHLRVGQAVLDLRYERDPDGVMVTVIRQVGELAVHIERA